MDLVGDERAQSIQIGAVLLFGVLVIAFSSYQAFVVPQQNQEVEFNHNQQVHSQMQDLRNAIVSVRGTDTGRSVSVQLGTRYPSRVIARNPGPPSGSLRTVGTTDETRDLTIRNAQANGETGDFWSQDRSYNTGGIAYRPSYNVYTSPPESVYENTVLYNRFRSGTITLANQSFIDGTEVSLVVVNGTVSAASTQSTSVDIQSVSSSTERVRLEDDGTPIVIEFTSQRSADYWDFLVNTQGTVTDVRSTDLGNGFHDVEVELDQSETYSVQLTKVGVGTGVTDENAAYMTDIDGDGSSVSQGETTELTLEVRDRLNNPPADRASITVEGSVAGSGSLRSTTATPDEDGQVTFVYEATGSTGTQDIQFSYIGIDGSFDATTPQNVSMTVDVTSGGGGGGGSAYSVAWQNPADESGNDATYLSDCSASSCTWDAGNDPDSTLTLRSGTSPAIEGTTLDFAVDDSSVGTVSPGEATTGSSGEATTDLTANADGTVGVYAASGGSSDAIDIKVENVGGGGNGAPMARFTTSVSGQTVNVDASGSSDPDGDSLSYEWDWTSDGTYDDTGVTASHTYGSSGDKTITLRVSDGNGGTDTVSQTVTISPTYTINSVSATSAGTGNGIDVTFDISTTDSNAQVEVLSLDGGSERDSTGIIAVSNTQPQTETISGDNQADQVRVILYDGSGTEQARTTISYP